MTSKSIGQLKSPHIPVSWGELFDKISILEIKKEKAADQTSLKNVNNELGILREIIPENVLAHEEIYRLRIQLKTINQNIWDIEDEIRIKESFNDFSQSFIVLARNTYLFNDNRASIKRKINNILNSEIIEEKIY